MFPGVFWLVPLAWMSFPEGLESREEMPVFIFIVLMEPLSGLGLLTETEFLAAPEPPEPINLAPRDLGTVADAPVPETAAAD